MPSVSPSSAAGRLAGLQSIADAALLQLDPQTLMTELLGRLKDIMQADTAAILLLDRVSGQLIATAAAGLEEEVRQNVRIPLGAGFAGRIAAQRHPIILDAVTPGNVLNPILYQKGIQSLVGAPMVAGGTVIGVLHVGSLRTRHFTAEEAGLLQLAADRAAVAVQSVNARADHAAAAALQRSLVPAAPAPVPGMDLAARYAPGRGDVGGDWYDVFTLPSGQLCAVIGDVAGAGLRAAVIMGRMRSALRAYAMETADPAQMLARLDAKMQHFEPDALASVLCAVFDANLERVHLSTAGHLPPAIIRDAGPAELAELPPDLLIGVAARAARHTTTLATPPGTMLCMYTDGLVEIPGIPLDTGLDRLCAAFADGPAESACATILAALAADRDYSDDVALLVLRRQQPAS
jgi:phosphoserine phosphatase RsbU/P